MRAGFFCGLRRCCSRPFCGHCGSLPRQDRGVHQCGLCLQGALPQGPHYRTPHELQGEAPFLNESPPLMRHRLTCPLLSSLLQCLIRSRFGAQVLLWRGLLSRRRCRLTCTISVSDILSKKDGGKYQEAQESATCFKETEPVSSTPCSNAVSPGVPSF